MKHDFYITYADLPLSRAPRAWVEVDAAAIRHNYRTVAAAIAEKRKDCHIIAVIKGEAYGHGIAECTRIFLSEGCRAFALANVRFVSISGLPVIPLLRPSSASPAQ